VSVKRKLFFPLLCGIKSKQNFKNMKTQSKSIEKLLSKVDNFNQDLSVWQKLQTVSASTKLTQMGLNQALKHYLLEAKSFLTDEHLNELTFANVRNAIASNEQLSELTYFTYHQIATVCNRLLAQKFAAIKKAEQALKLANRVEKQNKKAAAKLAA
jgi:predicted ribosome quality control (RQC) complex YloA/Tae2 family protein